MDFSEEVKSIRQKSFLSQEEFAVEIGVAFSTVNRWEKAKALPNYQAMKRLIAYCNKINVNSNKLELAWKESKNA